LTVIECPKCGSKFKIEKDLVARDSVKMRCSVCSHVFVYQQPEKASVEEDFDLLIGTKDGELEEKPLQDSITKGLDEGMPEDTGIVETREEEEELPGEARPAEHETQPESVIREIDSILGAGEEIATREEGIGAVSEIRKRFPLKVVIPLAAAVILVIGAGLWFMKDSIPFFQDRLGRANLERGPFFTIPDNSVTYEILTNSAEGSVLVIKGVIKKLTPKPLKSVMVEARVYDKGSVLVDRRSAYAGIVPDSSELMRQKSSEIDTLLSAEPRALGVLETSSDIPFAVAFFGKAARESYSFQVEGKEFHWK
jgi:predicted Zn finger-like uncharacterized protein